MAGYTSGPTSPCYYDFDVDIFACIEEDNTLKVFWNTPSTGYNEVINSGPNWDGNELSETFTENGNWPQAGNGGADTEVEITVNLLRVENGSTVVQVDWSIVTIGGEGPCSPSGSFEIILTAGEGCTTPPVPA